MPKKITKKRHQNVPASYLALMKDDQVLLLRRFNTGYQDGNYSLVAGHVDPDETFTQCMIREAKEEAGIILTQENLEVAHVMHRNSQEGEYQERVDVFFVAKSWRGEPKNIEPNKCDDLAWFSLDNLPENILPYVGQALDSIRTKTFYSEHGWD